MRELKEFSVSSPEMELLASDVLLKDESLDALSEDEITSRQALSKALIEQIPVEAFDHTQILQPAIGCINRCNFCSQQAGATTREMSAETLRAVIGGIRGALQYHERTMIGRERSHKPGVIFPYLDNDIGSYPHLGDLVAGVSSLGARTRISTVGWSRHNAALQQMHENIAAEHADEIDGVRFSLTPYTYGRRTNREEYIADFANALKTYKPLMEEKGVSRRFACVEMRFRPDVSLTPVEIRKVGEHTVVTAGDYTLVARGDLSEVTRVGHVEGMTPHLTTPGAESLQIIGDASHLDAQAIEELFDMTDPNDELREFAEQKVLVKKGSSYLFENADGPYYCFEPVRQDKGSFYGVHYYPSTESRPVSGVLDATRPLLNEILRYKNQRGVEARQDLTNTSSDDITAVCDRIVELTDLIARYAPRRAEYIRDEIMPLVEDAVSVIEQAELGSDAFFAYGFLIDTGVIVNQGKAITEFQGLASRPDMPLTPNEEKGYGHVSQSSNRGISWRIAPVEMVSGLVESSRLSGYGKKSLPLVEQTSLHSPREQKRRLYLGVMALNPEAFKRYDNEGTLLRSYYIPLEGHHLSKLTPKDAVESHLMPGSKRV